MADVAKEEAPKGEWLKPESQDPGDEQPELRIVGDTYEVGRKLGSGSFGVVHFVINTTTGDEMALKMEKDKPGSKLLHEARVLMRLQGGVGISNVHWFDTESGFNLIVMDLLGPSLGYIFRVSQKSFSVKTVLLLADQILHRLEHIHSKGIVHRDIKPENFLIGHKEKANMVYLIDFGLAKEYRNMATGEHIPTKEGLAIPGDKAGEAGKTGFVGTVRYASVNAHKGMEQSRRDDVEAVSYLLLFFLLGKLPWQGITASSREEKKDFILDSKVNAGMEVLRGANPTAFVSLLTYCRSLHFEDRPNYGYLRRIFKDVAVRKGYINDGMMDWSQPRSPGLGVCVEGRDVTGDDDDREDTRVAVGDSDAERKEPEVEVPESEKQVSRRGGWRGQVSLVKVFGACLRGKRGPGPGQGAADVSKTSGDGAD